MARLKNKLIGMLYTVLLGVITGAIVWAFLRVMNLGIGFLWDFLPSQFSIPFYTVGVCLIGSLLIGLYKSKFGDYPEELGMVLGKLKKNGRYPYNNLLIVLIAALLPLLIGAAIGPEAGLTGVIVGLCCWVGDKLKRYYKEASDLASIGASATLGTIFRSPMFGFVEPLEGEADTKLPKASKTVLYILAILSSFGIFILLNKLTGGSTGFCAIGGLALGIIGTLLPLTMFSGEHEIEKILSDGKTIGIVTLLIIAVAKLFLTNVCIASWLKGGHFFPVIFSGIAAGYAFSMIIGIDPGMCMAVVTAALLGSIMKKPVAVTLLLLILFPWQFVPVMLGASALGGFFDLPRFFNKADK